jgi:hypothetical protein
MRGNSLPKPVLKLVLFIVGAIVTAVGLLQENSANEITLLGMSVLVVSAFY